MFRIIAAIWATFWIVACAKDVGTAYTGGVYSMSLPFAVGGLVILSMVLGALAYQEWWVEK